MIVSRAVFETGDDGNPHVTLDAIGDLSPYVLEDFERHRHGPMMLQVRGESDLPTKLAFLSWAFLALFAKFGYTYALARCSRLVRKALIDRQATFGEAFFIRYGDLPKRFREMTVGLAVAGKERAGGVPDFKPLGLGVALDDAVIVCLPMAGDDTGERLRALEAEADEVGTLDSPVLMLPFGDIYACASGRSFVDGVCGFYLNDGGYSPLTVIGTTPDEASETLVAARAPRVARYSKPPRNRIRDNWEDMVKAPPAHVQVGDWSRTIAEDLGLRLEAEAAPPSLVVSVRALFASGSPAEFAEAVGSLVEPHLASHVRDSYRLFILDEHPPVSEDLRLEEAISRIRALLEAAGHGEASIAFSSALIDPRLHTPVHALAVVDRERELIIGGYYTRRTALIAAEVMLPTWLRE
jgi:hypothetical protein